MQVGIKPPSLGSRNLKLALEKWVRFQYSHLNLFFIIRQWVIPSAIYGTTSNRVCIYLFSPVTANPRYRLSILWGGWTTDTGELPLLCSTSAVGFLTSPGLGNREYWRLGPTSDAIIWTKTSFRELHRKCGKLGRYLDVDVMYWAGRRDVLSSYSS